MYKNLLFPLYNVCVCVCVCVCVRACVRACVHVCITSMHIAENIITSSLISFYYILTALSHFYSVNYVSTKTCTFIYGNNIFHDICCQSISSILV